MRKIQNIAFVLLAALSVSCINDHMEPTLCRDGELTLNFTTRSLDTRVQGDNDDVNRVESIIHDLQYFLYVKESGDEAAPLAAGVITGITDNEFDDDGPTEGEDPGDRFSKTVSIDATALQQLCPNEGDECEIYVIANLLENDGNDLTKDLANATRKKLKATKITSDFDKPNTLLSFVMDSEGTDLVKRVTGNKLSNAEYAPVYLTRAAAKIMIELKVQTAVDAGNATWIPVTDVSTSNSYKPILNFYNGVKVGVIDNGSDDDNDVVEDIVETSDNTYFNKETIQMIGGTAGGNGYVDTGNTSETVGDKEFKTFVAMDNIYSYTSSWSDTDSDAPTFKLTIYWQKQTDEGGTWVAYDYTVPVNLKTNQLVRNKLYLIRLTIGALGELSDLSEYQYSYEVLDWVGQGINAELSRPKYLVVEKNYVEMSNIEEISVGFQSSDKVGYEVVSTTIGPWVKETNGTTATTDDYYKSGSVYTTYDVNLDNISNSLTFKHKLDNVRDDKVYDYFVQETVVRIYHLDNPSIFELVTFVQYPAIYVQGYLNTGHANYSSSKGNVFVNNNQSNNSNWNVVAGSLNTGTSNSPYMYVITVSSLGVDDKDLYIGDPRVSSIDNLGYSFTSADALYDGPTRALKYYYPTNNSKDYENFIAPRFRICSGYGRLASANLDDLGEAEMRCASYQEDGYPAGRWRVPTRAELQFVGRLCSEIKIPNLFSNRDYWAASTAFSYSNGSFTETTSADLVRCVYDDWYWGSDRACPVDEFTWGDEKR